MKGIHNFYSKTQVLDKVMRGEQWKPTAGEKSLKVIYISSFDLAGEARGKLRCSQAEKNSGFSFAFVLSPRNICNLCACGCTSRTYQRSRGVVYFPAYTAYRLCQAHYRDDAAICNYANRCNVVLKAKATSFIKCQNYISRKAVLKENLAIIASL